MFIIGNAIVACDIFEKREIYANTVEDNLRILVNVPRNFLSVCTYTYHIKGRTFAALHNR